MYAGVQVVNFLRDAKNKSLATPKMYDWTHLSSFGIHLDPANTPAVGTEEDQRPAGNTLLVPGNGGASKFSSF